MAGMTRDEAILRCASAMVLNADDITSLNYWTQLAERMIKTLEASISLEC
jgi:hypothetical protein